MAISLEDLKLKDGAHSTPDEGMCVMEAAAYFAGEEFSDHPSCVSPVIGAFMRRWNDDLSEEDRNRLLKPYVTKVVGTNTGRADDEKRAWLVTDWMVRTYLPAWLEVGGMQDQANAVRGLSPVLAAESWRQSESVVQAASQAAAAAGATAWDAAGATAWDAAWATAGATAWDAAWDAARAAAGATAWADLQPTVDSLQRSALELLDELIAVGKTKSAA